MKSPLATSLPAADRLPVLLLAQYLFFLSRRPVSRSNAHYLESRLSGLKSLSPTLATAASPVLQAAARRLAALTPASFGRLAPELHAALVPLAEAASELPPDLVVTGDPPPEGAILRQAQRILLVFGPGIGIGDEVIFFPFPTWLREQNPSAEVVVLSAYPELWDRVQGVKQALYYSLHSELLQALRGESPYDGFDLVVLADFELPRLYPAVAAAGGSGRYLEIALGSGSAVFFDHRWRWLQMVQPPFPYCRNYYSALSWLARTLGLAPRGAERFSCVRQEARRPAAALTVFVAPFTSKYNPSEPYWSYLLAALAAWVPGLRFVLDTGKNPMTERFAAGLQRSLAARVPRGVGVELAAAGESRSLGGVLRLLESSHAVVCADSFVAHAAPQLGAAALVVARPGLERWRVPHAGSFYFSSEVPAAEVSAGMGQVLWLLGERLAGRAAPPLPDEARLDHLAERLLGLFDGDPGARADTLCALYADFVQTHETVVAGLSRHRRDLPGIVASDQYLTALRSPGGEVEADAPAGLLLHLRDQVERWHNTNLLKYVRLARQSLGDASSRETTWTSSAEC